MFNKEAIIAYRILFVFCALTLLAWIYGGYMVWTSNEFSLLTKIFMSLAIIL